MSALATYAINVLILIGIMTGILLSAAAIKYLKDN
jgi:hypothetical protein